MPGTPIQHSPQFVARRTQNWFVLGLTYAAMYMARYNFPLANKSLSDAYGWDKAQVGVIISTATLLYGLSALFNGPIADRFGGRKAMLVGATGAFVFNALFGLAAYLGVLGTGAPNDVRAWVAVGERDLAEVAAALELEPGSDDGNVVLSVDKWGAGVQDRKSTRLNSSH